MGVVSCYIEHVITFEFVSEFAFRFVFAFVSCCIRFFHLPVKSCMPDEKFKFPPSSLLGVASRVAAPSAAQRSCSSYGDDKRGFVAG